MVYTHSQNNLFQQEKRKDRKNVGHGVRHFVSGLLIRKELRLNLN